MNRSGNPRLLAAIVLTLTLSACGSSGDAKTADPAEPTVTLPPGSPKVKLIDAGTEPREKIRLDVTEGDVQRSSMTMKMGMKMTIDGQAVPTGDVPAMTMGMRVEVTDVRDDGVIVSEFSYDDVSVEGTGSAAEDLEKSLEDVTGLRGSMESTTTGAILDAELDIPDDLDSSISSFLTSFESQVQNMAVPLPTEAVGVGATWTATTETELNGISAEGVARYELEERTDDGVVLSVSIEQTAPEQDPDFPGMPPGATVHLESMEMKGGGETVLDLGMPLTVSMTSSIEGEIRMTVEAEGESGAMLQEMEMRVELKPR